ncbi:sugar ABC transporter substrate-binding protein [Alkalicoccus daliensis]|uniref:Monosaccharide ABC transporter substrate-binding protein, CUT2 family (TC 3.A.1.2.-) n=1 Tax=Alkalicoccus daliensis TaxID=745820 RepID=A0A1H0HC76_9BACI|nr:sugar ABC transporter substrate-binding protein [Alkalicoccus daliensis]SDO16491.1 monosaccharide ABC transporter substrate-binding protein, CUT2 family (TC 3.A.1.2.-) [Alkalicoccus daliensis]
MKKRNFRKSLLVAAVSTVFLAGCGEDNAASNEENNGSSNNQSGNNEENENEDNSNGAASADEEVPERFSGDEEVDIRVIRKIGGDDHTAQFLAGASEEGNSLGFNVDLFTADGNSAQFHDAISQAIQEEVDGLVISHGDDEATYEAVEEAREAGIEVVTFDSIPELTEIDNVTVTSQDDEALATLVLDQLVEDYDEEANIVYLWVDGFPPMVRRNNVYLDYLEEYDGLEELERFGVAAEDTTVQTQNAVASMLNANEEGEIDAIFATWDAFAIGAARAINEAGRDEIDIYGIDVSNADLEIMQEEGSPWLYTAAVDPKVIGAVNMRILAKKLAGEDTPDTYDLEADLISQEDLQSSDEAVNMQSLNQIIPGWGETDEFLEDWMEVLKSQNE